MSLNIMDIVLRSAQEVADIESHSIKVTEDTIFGGSAGIFDSMALVTVITAVEQNLSDEMGKDISITDDSMFSAKDSPLKSAGTLVAHIEKTLDAQ